MCMQPKGEAYMIIVNRHTKEHLNLDYPKFRKRIASRGLKRKRARLTRATKRRFSREIQEAFESYKQTQLNKTYYGFKDDNSMEFNFYFEIQYNLRLVGRVRSAFAKQNTQTRLTPTNKHNSFGNSAWYIERM